MSSRLVSLAPRGRCLPAASARASRQAARPLVPKTKARASPRGGVSRGAPEPLRASPADTRGPRPPQAGDSVPESHDGGNADEPLDARPSPATVAFEPLPDDTACVAWTDHMRWLFQRLDEAIGPLSPVALDPELQTRTGPPEKKGRPRVESWVYTSPFARRVRFTYVDEGAEKQIFNAVVYPAPRATPNDFDASSDARHSDDRSDDHSASTHLGDCPLLGVDLLCLAKGKNILVGLDLQPLSRDEAYLNRYADDLKKTRDGFDDLQLATPSARFYEDALFFSPAMLFARPDAKAMAAAAASSAAAAAGVETVPLLQQDDVCGAEGEACGTSLVRERTLDAVKAYAEFFLALLDASPRRVSERRGSSSAPPAVASDVVVLEENQNIYDRAKSAEEAKKTGETIDGAHEASSLPCEEDTSLGEMAETEARADASLAVLEASERLGADVVGAGSALFGATEGSKEDGFRGSRFAKRSSGRSSRVLSVEETAAAHDAHDDWQRERDPAVLLFAGWFGKPWAELMAREVLFPRGLATRELEER